MSDINSPATSNAIIKSNARLGFSVAVAYAATGWLGLAFAIPPGYASPVFPAAGLALGCVLWFGPTGLSGVWLGSGLLNLSHLLWAGTLKPSTAVAAMVIATGAAAQAWAGSRLVHRWQGPSWRTLESERDVFVFMLLGGVLAGVISSSTGVIALQASGVIERAQFLFTAWNWYTGDVLGVFVFAPLTLCLLSRRSDLWLDRRRRIVMPMLLALGLVALTFYGAARWERQAQLSRLETDGETVYDHIADRVIAHREVLASVKHFIETIPDFSFKQFELFTRITLEDNPDIFALSFNDLVPDEERPAFEGLMSRLSPLGPFRITERNVAQSLVPAMKRPEYVTVRYIVPLADNEPAVGYDIYSEPVRRDAINRARASGDMAVTAPIRLVQEQRQTVGVLELLPVTRAQAGTAEGQRQQLVGFAVGVVKIDEMIDIATRGHIPGGLTFQLIDPHAPDGQGLLYVHGSPAANGIHPDRALRWKTTLRMGDRDWILSVEPTEEYQRLHRPWMAWAVGVAGLLFASLFQILMLGMTGRTFIIQRKNEAVRISEEVYRGRVETTPDWIWELDAEGRFIYASDKVRDLLGYWPEEVIGRTPFDLMPETEAGRAESLFREAAARHLPFRNLENTNLHKNGSQVALETSGVPIFGPGGEFRGYRGMDRDITERKEAQAALRDSEERFRFAMEASRDGLWDWNVTTDEVYYSPGYATLLGYTPGEVPGQAKSWKDLIHPEDKAATLKANFDCIENRRDAFEVEFRMKAKNGDWLWILGRGKAVARDHAGRATRMVGTHTDITERKRAEEVLLGLSIRQHALLAAIPDIVMEVDLRRIYIWANQAGFDFFGADVLGRQASAYFEGEQDTYEAVESLFRGAEEVIYLESWQRRRDGRKRLLAWWCRVLKDEQGRVTGALSSARDITEAKQAETALRESEARFRHVVESSPLAISVASQDTAIEYINPKFIESFGYGIEDIPTVTDWWRFACPDPAHRQSTIEHTQNAFTAPQNNRNAAHGIEVEVTCKCGSSRTVEVFGSRMGNKTLAFYNDLTERKRMEEERRRLDAQVLELQKLESLGVLAGGFAHGFNNLLMTILGNSDLALLKLPQASPVCQHLKEITRASQRAAEICRQMLDYSGRGHYLAKRRDISAIVRGMEGLLDVSVSRKAVIHYSLAEGLPAVESDATQIRQVIMNLVTNAAEALGDTTGIITVTTGVMECTRACLSESHVDDGLPGGTYVTLEVSDTGCGMDAATRCRIFDPFFTTKFTGRGLGLAAVLGIVRSHKGAIKVYSEVGKGTVIKILLPAAQ